MNIPQLTIHSVPAKIAMDSQQAAIEMKQIPSQLQMEQPQAQLSVNIRPAKLTIDQSSAWAQMNLKPLSQLVREYAQKGRNAGLEATAKIAQQGTQLMKIENGGNPLVEQAKQNSEIEQKQFNIGWVPSPFSVKVHYQPGELKMDWKTQRPRIKIKPGQTSIQYHRGSLEVYLQQKNSIEFNVKNI